MLLSFHFIPIQAGFIDDFWLGGTELGDRPHYYWMGHNKAMIFTDWAPNQPDNNGGVEHCIMMWGTTGMQWNDASCDFQAYFICERDIKQT